MRMPIVGFCSTHACGHQVTQHTDEGVCRFPGCRCQMYLTALTHREGEVLMHLAQGRTVKEAAEILKVSTRTVDNHRNNIFNKTGAHTSLQLVLGALRAHLINLEDLPQFPVRVVLPLNL